ncbi:DUF4386 domain-containing protein [Acetobacterium malicum]|uniref:DUF4386 domain-containing protein n=1 Tax=Acetobacterium malicum TaxID=52692 RepID=UPI000417C5CE|nr:DUF4386 domain-containing protein [Acetobacterium dehalogenans]
MFKTEIISPRKAAVIVGVAMLMIIICAGFAFGFAHSSLVIVGDAETTVSQLLGNLPLFRAEIFSWFLILVFDIIIAWAISIFMKQIDTHLALLGGWFRLSYSVILGVAISNLLLVSLLLSDPLYSAFAQTNQLTAQVTLYLNAFDCVWSLGLIVFGLHLLIIAYLILKSDFIPKFLGILLLIAALSYVLIHSMYLFLPQYETATQLIETILSLPMTAGELGFGLWLLIKGGKTAPKSN